MRIEIRIADDSRPCWIVRVHHANGMFSYNESVWLTKESASARAEYVRTQAQACGALIYTEIEKTDLRGVSFELESKP